MHAANSISSSWHAVYLHKVARSSVLAVLFTPLHHHFAKTLDHYNVLQGDAPIVTRHKVSR
jgi:hypothetical protein